MNYHNEIHDNEHSEYESDDYSESETESVGSMDSKGSMDSIESFSGDLSQLRHIVATINATIETLETQLISIQRPIEALHVEQLGDTPFLISSPFRHTMLKFKSDVGIPGIDVHKRHSFADIMSAVRAYVFANDAVRDDGSIHLSKAMRKALGGIKESSLTYVELMQHMREIVH
jgi:hypothetical protein